MKATYCAWCMVALPRPSTWKGPDGATREVRDWPGAVAAAADGFHYTTPDWLTYGIHAVTFVDGTAACYGHGYFLAQTSLYGGESPSVRALGR